AAKHNDEWDGQWPGKNDDEWNCSERRRYDADAQLQGRFQENRCHASNGYRELHARHERRAEARRQHLCPGGNATGRWHPVDGSGQCWTWCGAADVAPGRNRSVDARAPGRRMCRTACGDTEIARKLRQFAHEPDETIVPATGKPRFALLFDRTAYFIATRQPVNVCAVFCQSRQKMRQIHQLVGNDVDDAAFFLHNTENRYITRPEDDRPQALEYFRPYDYVGDRCFIFDRHKYDAI